MDRTSEDDRTSITSFVPTNMTMNEKQLFVKMALDTWSERINATSKLVDQLTDDQLMNEVAPGRNRGIYLVGHLASVHDQMLPLLRFQEMLYPELKPVFIDAADRTTELPAVAQVREQWKLVHYTLMGHITRLPPEVWFTRHASITEEDFEKEPHRNRLNLLMNRTNHLSYHRGQLALLASK